MRWAECRLVIVAAWFAVGGCQFKGQTVIPHDLLDSDEYWEIKPVQIRVYPTTAFVERGDTTVLNARVEFFDEMGDSVKAVGRCMFELHRASRLATAASSQRLYTWQVSMLTLSEQRRHYDPVSRTYLFPLELITNASPPQDAVLSVSFTGLDSGRLTTQAELDAEHRGTQLPPRHRSEPDESPLMPDLVEADPEPR